MKQKKVHALTAPSFASLALAFASFGDAFLYAFLPVNNLVVGIPVVWVGVLLSINRFVRILSNGIMVHLFAKYGLRLVMILATVLAILSTAGYGVASGILLWIVFRIAWGLSFSALRIGTIGYALQHARQGLALGVTRSLHEAGPMLSLFLAPLLIKNFEANVIFFLLAGFSLPALWFAWRLPNVDDRTPAAGPMKFPKFPSTFNLITLVSAIVVEGILIVVLGILFLKYRDHISLVTATALAAFYLGYRRACLVFLSPLGGWLADTFGLDKVFNISVLLMIIGLLVVAAGWVATGAVIVFTFYSINSAISPGTASKNQAHALAAVAQNATWRDVGTAVGTLTGGFLLTSAHLTTVLLFADISLLILLIVHLGASKTMKSLYVWK